MMSGTKLLYDNTQYGLVKIPPQSLLLHCFPASLKDFVLGEGRWSAGLYLCCLGAGVHCKGTDYACLPVLKAVGSWLLPMPDSRC